MWPFSRNKQPSPVPAIRVGEISVRWDCEFEWWEFSDGQLRYSLCDNPEFDVALLNELGQAKQWLIDLDEQISAVIKKHLWEGCDWNGVKNVIGIDVSSLLTKREIDVSYADDSWGDLGVNVIITAGKITESYAGD